ncbi:2-dehydropantoate 2-reductase [Rheinheimera sp.]|uniref:2-dehydropantoate 2-reductase n=1 Tax=Rheinheimera sp. TaxID=1869214 RepID=UPI0027B91A71|nr:2-dehydropantoate 2-reductase [Rheinheimera sp.]
MPSKSGLEIQSQYRSAAIHSTVGIVGAGSIGCFLGAILAQDKSLSVQFFGREALGLELAAYGLSAAFPGGNASAIAPAFYTSMVSLIDCDVILLTVKATSLPHLIPQLKKFIRPDVPVIALQNGIGVDTMLSASLNNPVYRAVVPFNVVKTGPGHFQQTSAGQLLWPQSNDNRLSYLAAIFRQHGSGVQLCADMRAVEYGKLLLNLNNALNALSGLPLKQQLLQQDIRLVLAAAMQEWLMVCKTLQIKPQAMTALPNELLPWLLRLPTWLFRVLARQMLLIDEAARSSMWDDIQAGRRTEVMYLNGAVVRLGIETGVPTPVNSAIVELVKHLEQGEAIHLSPQQLRQQLLASA